MNVIMPPDVLSLAAWLFGSSARQTRRLHRQNTPPSASPTSGDCWMCGKPILSILEMRKVFHIKFGVLMERPIYLIRSLLSLKKQKELTLFMQSLSSTKRFQRLGQRNLLLTIMINLLIFIFLLSFEPIIVSQIYESTESIISTKEATKFIDSESAAARSQKNIMANTKISLGHRSRP